MHAFVFGFLLMLLAGVATSSASASVHFRCLAVVNMDKCYIEELFTCHTYYAANLKDEEYGLTDSNDMWTLTWRRRRHLLHRANMLRELKWNIHLNNMEIMYEEQLLEKLLELACVLYFNNRPVDYLIVHVAEQLSASLHPSDAIRFVGHISSDIREKGPPSSIQWHSPYLTYIEQEFLNMPQWPQEQLPDSDRERNKWILLS
ncbi:uncharacterized protein LOC117590935 [Drosophila guanche]|uniref:Uncharacterized protein n=1 Tax=Drosophila guanche TaxID=7266 RepID=A0A3B0K5H8_DROGU|nr:uncharacterized protein LOC117590935 [Drosophila guanche]SPP89395.1 Hypothetical predicted protein [Drosophila guanche]